MMASPHPRPSGDSLDADSPPTLMGMMMSCSDLPSTLTPARSPRIAPAVTVTPITPPRSNPHRPSSTWHSDADTSDSVASTAVDAPATPAAASRTNTDEDADAKQPSAISEEFIQISHPSPSPDRARRGRDRDHSPDRSPPSSPPQSHLHQRGRLGHFVSISGIKRSLSQSDLRVGGPRRPSRIKAAVSKLSRNWTRGPGAGHGEEQREKA